MKRKGAYIAFLLAAFLMPAASLAEDKAAPQQKDHILVAYFSRMGNTDYASDVDASSSASIVLREEERVGTTEAIADVIVQNVGGDKFLIQTLAPYPEDFQSLVDLNHREADDNTRPALQNTEKKLSSYDVIFLGYPVWANSVPRAVLTFLETHDFSGKVIIPFCTHNGYGPGKSVEEIRLACDEAQILAGFDISSEQMQTAEDAVTSWLEEVWNALPQ